MIDRVYSFIVQYNIWISWIFVSSIMIIYGIALYINQYLPDSIHLFFTYGKSLQNKNEKRVNFYTHVPKRWFKHFYIFASIYHSGIALCVWKVYLFGSPPPLYLQIIIKLFLNSGRSYTAIPEAVVIATVLILLQVYRRCYECHYILVFSNSKMNVIQYLVGYFFYFGVGLSLLSEAPGFTKPGGLKDIVFKQCWLEWNHIVGVAAFLWAWRNQLASNKILAGLRKDSNGKTVTLKHNIPTGSLFDFVTNPHYFCEIVMYFSIQMVLGYRNITWWLLCCWVLSSHIVMAFSSHDWYKQKFPSYTASRKALIPYIL